MKSEGKTWKDPLLDRDEKTWKDLNWDAVNFESSQKSKDPNAGHWGWGRGGSPHGDHEYSISYVDDELKETRYKMPAAISEMLRMAQEWGKEDAKKEIRAKIGCYSSTCPMEEETIPVKEEKMLDSVIDTYRCLLSCRKKMPGMKLEDAFKSSTGALASLEKEAKWLLKQKEGEQ